MANFSRDGGDNRGGFRSGGGGRGFDKRDSRPMVLHDAICNNCGNKFMALKEMIKDYLENKIKSNQKRLSDF